MTLYRLEFSETCLRKLSRIADVFDIHEILAEVYESLRQNPRAYDIVPPLGELRYVKTIAYRRGDVDIPPLTFYFRIYEDDRVVRMMDVIYRDKDGKLVLS